MAQIHLLVALQLCLAVVGVSQAVSEPAPERARAWSFEIHPEARARVEPLTRAQLVDDTFFVQELGKILRGPLPLEAKVDAFTLMQDRIGWLFAGTVLLRPGHGYIGTLGGQVATLVTYQDSLKAPPELAHELVRVARKDCDREVIRCASALLLASLVDRKVAAEAALEMVATGRERAAQIPDIMVHAIALTAALSREDRVVVGLGPLLKRLTTDEAREDVLCALSMYSSKPVVNLVTGFIEARIPITQGNAVQTALVAAKLRLGPDFGPWIEKLRESLEPEARAALDAIAADRFSPPLISLPGSPLKLWDGFGAVVYDDGVQVTHPTGFTYFRAS